MNRTLIMRRIVLPQAMRIIIPPTGNETIGMLKTTSLVTAVPFTLELQFATTPSPTVSTSRFRCFSWPASGTC
mgnify:FL=1